MRGIRDDISANNPGALDDRGKASSEAKVLPEEGSEQRRLIELWTRVSRCCFPGNRLIDRSRGMSRQRMGGDMCRGEETLSFVKKLYSCKAIVNMIKVKQ